MPQGVPPGEVDIARSLRIIEWLKTELLENTCILFKAMLQGSEEMMLDALAGIVISVYVLARRLGFSFLRLEKKITSKIQLSIAEDHEVEKWYRDLSTLSDYLSQTKR